MNALLEWLKPYARAVKYALLYRRARRQAERDRPGRAGRPTPPLAFIFACGRSGTTVLGKIFAAHPDVRYLFEPYHSWAAIDPRTDMLQLYVESDGRCLMDAADVNENIRTRFRRVIREANADPGVKLVMEKTPINALRLGYLMELAPDAKFIHIVRDGVDVARSIAPSKPVTTPTCPPRRPRARTAIAPTRGPDTRVPYEAKDRAMSEPVPL